MSGPTIFLDGMTLTVEQVLAVAYDNAPVALAEHALAPVQRAADAVRRLLERGTLAYGITTGFGAFKDRVIPLDQVRELQRNILVSHAAGVGEPFDIPTTRAIMLIRANTLARGFSGIQLRTLQLLLALLNHGIHPVIPRIGSLGASGDLAPLAHMALPLIGEGDAWFDSERLPGHAALSRAGLQPVTLEAKEGLALTNGTAVMCALGVLATHRAERLMQSADVTAALSAEALHGTDRAFDERIHALRPFPRQQECARDLRQLLRNSTFLRPHDSSNVQDAYTLRCVPQVHGAVRDVVAYARWAFAIELNAVTDNPLLMFDANGEPEVISGGNFHGEPLALAMDYLSVALTDLGNMSERRVMRMTDEDSNTHVLPAFLTRHGGLNSGFMIAQYTAAALATHNKVLAHPAVTDTIPSSANVEDHVSMGVTSGLKLHEILDNVERIIAIELLAAAQGIDFRREALPLDARLGEGTRRAYALVRECVPFIERDTLMHPHIEAARKLVSCGAVCAAAFAEVRDTP